MMFDANDNGQASIDETMEFLHARYGRAGLEVKLKVRSRDIMGGCLCCNSAPGAGALSYAIAAYRAFECRACYPGECEYLRLVCRPHFPNPPTRRRDLDLYFSGRCSSDRVWWSRVPRAARSISCE